MTWENSRLNNFIRDRSFSIGEWLIPKQPERPENNPLINDGITKDQVKHREVLDNIQGTDTDDSLVGQLVESQTLGAYRKPIPRDHPYSKEDIGEFLTYATEMEEWTQLRDMVRERYRNSVEPELPSMSVVYSQDKSDFMLVMSSGGRYTRELGIDIMENVIGQSVSTQLRYFNKALPQDIELYLINVDFEQLRLRLINAGYVNYVNEINELLSGY